MAGTSKAFSEIGLTDMEGRILESLIAEGPATGSGMASRLGINKSVAYFVLEQLLQKGLVSSIVINKKREYRAIDPEVMKGRLDERKRVFMKNFSSMQALLKTVRAKRKRPVFNIFEGWDGMRTAFDDIVLSMKTRPKDVYFVFAVDVPEKVFPRFRRFIRKFHSKRSEAGVDCRLLVSSRLRSTIGKDRRAEPHTSVRFVSSEYAMPMAANVYANKVLLTIWTSPPLAITIESKDVHDSFKAFFHLLWKIGRS